MVLGGFVVVFRFCVMENKEIVNTVLGVVSEFTDVEVSDILSSCRKEDIVDARCIAIMILITILPIPYVCEVFKTTNQNVSYIKGLFRKRMRQRPYAGIAYKNALTEIAGRYGMPIKSFSAF